MIKALIDSNVLLDIALNREPYAKEALEVLTLIHENKVQGFVSALTISHLHYIIQKNLSQEKAIEFVKDTLTVFDVALVDKQVLWNAISSDFSDFEDAIQATSAQNIALDIIITRNTKDFAKSKIKVTTPKEFLSNF
jgi:predicted nucleic acid-binding protein